MQVIDRRKTCPFLLRIFLSKEKKHHSVGLFGSELHEDLLKDEIRIHTWADCTLRELSDLIKEQSADVRKRNTRLHFAIVYPDKTGRNVIKSIDGTIHAVERSALDDRTLADLHFETGDFIDAFVI
eukprot:TRINITY_DN774420_c0_g1_i1.p1 TRINITY_DN774420_c0_g1~~TRINITY_DN774420_c0_g1_i1.p1  ORF type:complete len:143 (-),score=14.34 TRINITY_DN774420_c0_g1_i1:295-672(-)